MKKSAIDLGRAEIGLYWLGNGVYDRKNKSKKNATPPPQRAVASILDVGPQLLDVHGRCARAIAGQMEAKRAGEMGRTPVPSAKTLNRPVVESFKVNDVPFNLNDTQHVVNDTRPNLNDTEHVVNDTEHVVEEMGLNLNDTEHVVEEMGLNLNDTEHVVEEMGPNLNDTEHVVDVTRSFVDEMGLVLTDRRHNLAAAVRDDAR